MAHTHDPFPPTDLDVLQPLGHEFERLLVKQPLDVGIITCIADRHTQMMGWLWLWKGMV